MITFFPEIYDDELLYSVFARYHLHSGNLTYRATAKQLYGTISVHPDMEFVNALSEETLEMLCRQKPLEELIECHTMYPAYARFLPLERRLAAYNNLLRLEGNPRNDLAIPNVGVRFLRYCPCCVAEDRAAHGETYWHRKHQAQRVSICVKHSCYLANSTVQLANGKGPELQAAELNVEDVEPEICEDAALLNFTEYLLSVMEAPVIRQNSTPVGAFLNTRLDGKYRSDSGLVRKIAQLYEDYLLFYEGSPVLLTQAQLKKVYNGFLFDNYFVCQLAFFEGISVKELTELPDMMVTDEMEELYEQLAKEHCLTAETVAAISKAVLKYHDQKRRVQYSPGVRSKAWNELDERLFPRVKQTVDDILYIEGRPVKLSVALIQKTLKLPEKQLYKLPRCLAYVRQHMETQQEYWAREVTWAIRSIMESGYDPSLRRIEKLTNMRVENFMACLKYIKDPEIVKISEEIANNHLEKGKE